MFRVLSEEESSKVVRWKPPEIPSVASGAISQSTTVTPLLGSASLKRFASSGASASPRLDLLAAGKVMNENTPIATASADMLQTSYDEGYEKGLADGSSTKQQKHVKELGDIFLALKNAVYTAEDTELEQEIIGLSMDIAKLVIRQELSIEPALIAQLVKAGLQQLHTHKAETSCVYLHPDDAECIRRQVSLQSDFTLSDDPSLERGSCRIESGASIVGVGVEDWLQGVAAELGFTGYIAEDNRKRESSDSLDSINAEE